MGRSPQRPMTETLRRFLRRVCGPLRSSDEPAPARLIVCTECGERVVNPVDWHENSETDWWVRLRCGACGFTRTGVIDDADAKRLERDLGPGLREIEAIVARLDRERMRTEADTFIAALGRDLIDPADFARRAPR